MPRLPYVCDGKNSPRMHSRHIMVKRHMLFEDAQQPPEEPPSYIDAHTHSWLEGDGVIRVRNIFPDRDSLKNLPETFSIGVHPFNLEDLENVNLQLGLIREAIQLNPAGAVAIGECGLDHFSAYPLKDQEEIFRKQIEISHEFDIPLIIHAVRAWHDIIRIKKETGSERPWLAHGFRSSMKTAEDLIDHNIMLSFGEIILHDQRTRDVLAEIPEESFVLETDESAIDIKEIYNAAAAIREIEVDELRTIVSENFLRFRNPEK